VWRGHGAEIALGALLLGGIAWLFAHWFDTQHRLSMNAPDDWGHAWVVPVISGFLVWRRREQIRATPAEVFWPALSVVLLGVMSYFFCLVQVRNHMLQGFSLILTVFGAALLVLGPRMMRWLFLPIAYLVFGVTIAEVIMLAVTFRLQLIASEGAWMLLSVIGSPFGWFGVELEGNTLTMLTNSGEALPLNVAEACSGMRMVVAFVALAGVVALVSARHWWQRVLLIVLAPVVAILMNVLRVAVLALLNLVNPELAAGDAHMLIGMLLLVPALGLYLGIVWALNRVVREEAGAPVPTPAAFGPGWGWLGSPRSRWVAGTACLAVLAGSALGFGAAIDGLGYHLRKKPIYPSDGRVLSALPRQTPSWTQVGTDRVESKEIVEELGTENYLNRTYVRREAEPGQRPVVLELHAAYYTGMIDTVPHVPERCFVGGGMVQSVGATNMPLAMDTSTWIPDPTLPVDMRERFGSVHSVRLPSDGRYTDRPGMRVRLPVGVTPSSPIQMRISGYQGDRIFAGYFFIANGGTVASAEAVRTLAFDLTSDYAYYLKVQVTSTSVGSKEELAEHAGSLIGELIGEIMRCTPDWVSVQSGAYAPLDSEALERSGG
jgi:exosortase